MLAIRIHTESGFRTGLLLSAGRKYMSVILADNPVRVHRLPLDSSYGPLQYKGKNYPIPRAKRLFRGMVKQWHGGLRHVSKPVREALK